MPPKRARKLFKHTYTLSVRQTLKNIHGFLMVIDLMLRVIPTAQIHTGNESLNMNCAKEWYLSNRQKPSLMMITIHRKHPNILELSITLMSFSDSSAIKQTKTGSLLSTTIDNFLSIYRLSQTSTTGYLLISRLHMQLQNVLFYISFN